MLRATPLLVAAFICSVVAQQFSPLQRSHFAYPSRRAVARPADNQRRAPNKYRTPPPTRGDRRRQPVARTPSPLDAFAPHLAECFTFTQNCVILDATPYERRINMDEKSCADMCMRSGPTPQGYECRSLTFDRDRGMCDLFAHAGNELPGRFHRYDGVDYYEMLPSCQHRSRALNAPQLRTVEPLSPLPTAFTDLSPTTSAQFATSTDTAFFTTTQPTVTENLSTGVNGSCPLKTTPLLQRSDGYDILARGETFFDHREEECVIACLTDGASINAPIKCLSFVYNTFTLDCTIYADRSQPLGGAGELRDNVETIFYEKMCIPDELTVLCPSSAVIERFPSMALIGFEQLTSTVDDYQQCVELCLSASKEFEFTCRSGQYFPTSKDNCVLNTVDHLQEPNKFSEQEEKGVQYFSLSICTAPPQTDSLSNILTDTHLATNGTFRHESSEAPGDAIGHESTEAPGDAVRHESTEAPGDGLAAVADLSTSTTTEAPDDGLAAIADFPTSTTTEPPKFDLMRKRLERLREYRQRRRLELSTLFSENSPNVATRSTDPTYPDADTFDTPNADYYEYSDQERQPSPPPSTVPQASSSLFDLKFNLQKQNQRPSTRSSGNS